MEFSAKTFDGIQNENIWWDSKQKYWVTILGGIPDGNLWCDSKLTFLLSFWEKIFGVIQRNLFLDSGRKSSGFKIKIIGCDSERKSFVGSKNKIFSRIQKENTWWNSEQNFSVMYSDNYGWTRCKNLWLVSKWKSFVGFRATLVKCRAKSLVGFRQKKSLVGFRVKDFGGSHKENNWWDSEPKSLVRFRAKIFGGIQMEKRWWESDRKFWWVSERKSLVRFKQRIFGGIQTENLWWDSVWEDLVGFRAAIFVGYKTKIISGIQRENT